LLDVTQGLVVRIDETALAANVDRLQRKQRAIVYLERLDVGAGIFQRLVDGAVLAELAHQELRDVARLNRLHRRAVEVNLDGLGNLEPSLALREAERGHR